MTIEEFRATARPCTDETWTVVLQELIDPPARETITEYADSFIMHEADGHFWPHAWLYSPVPMTRAAAEKSLFEWRAEFI